MGDLTVEFPTRALAPCYLELDSIDDVRVLAHRRLVAVLLPGATVRMTGPWLFRHFAIALARPGLRFDFLDQAGQR